MSPQRLFVLFALLSTSAYAQWLNFPTPGIPRARDGKPNLSAPAPRTAGGKPDLSGVWMHERTSVAEMKRLYGFSDAEFAPGMELGLQNKYGFNILLDFKPEESPLRPEAATIMLQRAASRNPADPCAFDFYGFPLAGLLSEPIKIIQSPRVTAVLYEVNNLHRQIFTDGRALPKEFNLPAYLGYSTGHWERDVLVVETAGFNDKTSLDANGHPHSEELRVTERFHRRDFGHMDVEMTFDDPKMYTKPFTIKVPHDLLADADIFEMFCSENEKDGAHMPKRSTPKERKEITINPKLLDGYTGKYEITPDLILTITREGDRLNAEFTGFGIMPIFPESERDFFVKTFDLQIKFVTDSSGRATEVIEHYLNDDYRGKRVK